MVVKYSKEVCDFIEANGSCSEDFYWFPFYFRKTEDGCFETTLFKDLPNELKHIIEQSEPRNEKEMQS